VLLSLFLSLFLGLACWRLPLGSFGRLLVYLTGALLIGLHPYAGVVGLVALIYLRPGETNAWIASLSLPRFVSGMTFLSWLSRRVARKETPFLGSAQCLWLLALCGTILVSSTVTEYWRGTVQLFFASFFRDVVLYFLLALLTTTPRRLHGMLWLLVALNAINGLRGLHTYLQQREMGGVSRALGQGIFGDPNDLALTLVVMIPFLLSLRRAEPYPLARASLGGFLVLSLLSVAATFSRGGFLGLLVVLFLALWERVQPRFWRFLLVGVTWVALIVGLRHTFRVRGLEAGAVQKEGRLWAWKAGWGMIKHSPLVGVGFGQFNFRFGEFAPPEAEVEELMPHNSFLQVAAELGLVGFLCYLGLLRTAFREIGQMEQAIQTHPVPYPVRATVEGLRLSVIGFLVCAFFLSHGYSVFLLIPLALGLAAQNMLRQAGALPVTASCPPVPSA